jgi:RNA polymerase sigma factor (sigma-70 family)
MSTTFKKYDLNLSTLASEELVVLAQECGYRPAANELVLRYHAPMGLLIARKARQTPLTETDIQDAQQSAVFALFEAIAGFNTLEMVKAGGCRFRTFAALVTLRRFWDFVKHVRRVQKRYRGSMSANGDAAPECPLESSLGHATNLRTKPVCDPAEAAARHEAVGRLDEALERCPEHMRRLWQEMAAGKTLRQIAQDRGVPYDALKRQRRKLLARLAATCNSAGWSHS